MEDFVRKHLSNSNERTAATIRTPTTLVEDVDVKQWLRNFAVMAVMVHSDSPMGNGNNYLLAAVGDGEG